MQTVIEEFHALCQKHDIKSKCDFWDKTFRFKYALTVMRLILIFVFFQDLNESLYDRFQQRVNLMEIEIYHL